MRYLFLVLALMSAGCTKCTQWHTELKLVYEHYWQGTTEKTHETSYRAYEVCDKGT